MICFRYRLARFCYLPRCPTGYSPACSRSSAVRYECHRSRSLTTVLLYLLAFTWLYYSGLIFVPSMSYYKVTRININLYKCGLICKMYLLLLICHMCENVNWMDCCCYCSFYLANIPAILIILCSIYFVFVAFLINGFL